MSIQALAWAIEESEAESDTRLVLISIANHAGRRGECSFPSIATIGREARCCKSTVLRAIERLEAMGELLVYPDVSPTQRGGRGNRYEMPKVPGWERPEGIEPRRSGVNLTPLSEGEVVSLETPLAKANRCHPEPEVVSSSTPKWCHPEAEVVSSERAYKEEPNENQERTENTPGRARSLNRGLSDALRATAPERKPLRVGEFDEFFAAYPRATNRDRARRAYRIVRERGASHEDLMGGLRAWADYWTAALTEERFIPGPDTWLENGRWNEAPPKVSRGKTPPVVRSQATDDDHYRDG